MYRNYLFIIINKIIYILHNTAEGLVILKALRINMDNTKNFILSDTLSAINSIKTKSNPSDIEIFVQN